MIVRHDSFIVSEIYESALTSYHDFVSSMQQHHAPGSDAAIVDALRYDVCSYLKIAATLRVAETASRFDSLTQPLHPRFRLFFEDLPKLFHRVCE